MNDPEAIRFVNEEVRPLAERIRALLHRLESLRAKWYGGMNNNFSNAGEAVEDGRESEGVSRLTCGDVTNFIGQAIKTAPGEAQAWNAEIVEKPCVQPLQS